MGRGGKKIPKRYKKECPICERKFKAKYPNRIYCSSKCKAQAFLIRYPNYHSLYYLRYLDQWLKYKDNNLKARKSIVQKDHVGTGMGDIRSKKEGESWEDYSEYVKKKRGLIFEKELKKDKGEEDK